MKFTESHYSNLLRHQWDAYLAKWFHLIKWQSGESGLEWAIKYLSWHWRVYSTYAQTILLYTTIQKFAYVPPDMFPDCRIFFNGKKILKKNESFYDKVYAWFMHLQIMCTVPSSRSFSNSALHVRSRGPNVKRKQRQQLLVKLSCQKSSYAISQTLPYTIFSLSLT